MKSYNSIVYPFQSKWLHIDGNNIHYIDEGQGEIIIFFHPPVTSSFMHRNIIKLLSPDHRCIALDFPGFGLSTAVDGFQYTIQSLADIAEKFIDKLHLSDFYFVMQQVGGHAAISAIMKHPENLKGIILHDTIIFPVTQYPKLVKRLHIVNGRVFNFLNSYFNLLIRISTRSSFNPRKLTRAERDTYFEMFNTKEKRRRTIILLYELAAQEGLMGKIQSAFENIFNYTPTLLIYGEKGSLSRWGVPHRIKEMLRYAELHIIKGVEYFPHEGTPKEMSGIIRNWIRATSRWVPQEHKQSVIRI
jgi:haloalkane dehalogenase